MRRIGLCLAFVTALVVAISPGVTAHAAATGAISGSVTDSAGAPLANVAVSIYQLDISPGASLEKTTAADGSYTADQLPVGRYAVCFYAQDATGGGSTTGYTDECWNNVPAADADCSCDPTPVAVTEGTTTAGISAQLDAAGAITGTVTDAGGQPVSGVEVYAERGPGTPIAPGPHTTTAADGSYRIDRVRPSDQYTVCFDVNDASGGTSTTGYLNQCLGDIPAVEVAHFPVPSGGTAVTFPVTSGAVAPGKDARLNAAGQLSGTVTNLSGAPIAGIKIYAWGDASLTATDVTDANGHYLLSVDNPGGSANGLAVGTRLPIGPYRIYFSTFNVPGFVTEYYHHAYSPSGQGGWGDPTLVTPTAGSPTTIDEPLASAGSISGVVNDSSGSALAGVHVRITHDDLPVLDDAITGSDGAYSLAGLPESDYRVCYGSDGATGGHSQAGYIDKCADVTLGAGEHRTGMDETLASASGISGWVIDEAGKSLGGSIVWVKRGGVNVTGDYTKPDGSYLIDRVVPGTYTVCFSRPWAVAGAPNGYADECYDNVPATGTPTPVVTTAGKVTTTIDAVLDALDKTPPTVKVTRPGALFATSTALTVAYAGSDAVSGVVNYDVQYRVAAWNGAFGAYKTIAAGTTAKSKTITGLLGHEYCFRVRARDHAGNVSAYSPDKCTVVPLDDRSLQATTGGWSHIAAARAFAATETKTTTAGAQLLLSGAHVDRIALMVTTCSTCGSVAIYVNGGLWRTVSTHASTTHYRVLLLPGTFSLHIARIALKSASPGRQLLIDGIGIARN